MPVAAFIQIVGFVLVAAPTAIAALAIFVYLNGGEDIDDLMNWVMTNINPSQDVVIIGAIVLAWAAASLPGFLLMSTGLNTESNITQQNDGKAQNKKLDEIAQTLQTIRDDARTRDKT